MIGFFDSGIGGLTVLYEALKILPNERFLYFSDGENAPYGVRPKEEVKQLVLNAVAFMAQQPLKALVIACNTATSVAIEDLRQKYDFPIIGMEPAVKPALALAAPKRVLVFATNLTLQLEKFQQLVDRVDTDNRVDYLPLQELVMVAERFEFDQTSILHYLHQKLSGFNLNHYGAVVLGCTHFPFFKSYMRQALPAHIHIVDGNEGTVRNLRNKIHPQIHPGPANIQYFISQKPQSAPYFERYLDWMRLQDTMDLPE
jgi:glutamate racemase